MPKNPFGIEPIDFGFGNEKTKRKRNLTPAQKLWCWENKPHKCNICGKTVNKQSDAEFDHTKSFSKGGATNLKNVKITHRQCNRLKRTKSLSETKKFLGIKTKSKTTKKKKSTKRKSSNDLFGLSDFKPPKIKLF